MKKQLQHRGQFFVKSVCVDKDVIPVDNFVFIETDSHYKPLPHEVTLAAVGSRTILIWQKTTRTKTRWFGSYAEALRGLADILEDKLKFKDFKDD